MLLLCYVIEVPKAFHSLPEESAANTTSQESDIAESSVKISHFIKINLRKSAEDDETNDQETAAEKHIEPIQMWPNLAAASRSPMPYTEVEPMYPTGTHVTDQKNAAESVPPGNGASVTMVSSDETVMIAEYQPIKIEPDGNPDVRMEESAVSAVTTKKGFVCERCLVAFETKEWLDIHICSKEKKQEYVCTLCNAGYKTPSMLHTHIVKYHQEREEKLREPKKPKATRIISPAPNENLLPLNPTYECELCKKEFGWKSVLQKHIETEHKVFTMKHVCKHCKKQFDSQILLEGHSCVVLECELCKIMFASKKERDKHWEENHDIRFKCTRCTRAFKSQFDLDRHIKSHPNTTCEICGKDFPFKGRLQQHRNTVHRTELNVYGPKIRFPCEQCDRVYKDKGTLKEHMVAEHGVQGNYNCEVCGKQFWLKTRLDMHVRTHTGEKPYQCTVCGKVFPLSSSLYVHVKKHSSERFECTICNTNYATNYYLKEHMKGHDGSAKLQCRICFKWLKNKNVRKSHEDAHKDERKYKCHVCGIAYNHSGSLHTHMKKHKEISTMDHLKTCSEKNNS